MRYAFRYSSNAYPEAQWYLFSLIFLLGGAYALKHNAHVRIDLVYGRLSKRTQAWIDLVGTLLFLIPMSLGVIYLSWDWVANAVAIREMSPDVGAAPLAHQDRPARGVRPSRPPGPLRAHQAAGLSDRAPARLDARGRGGGGLRWTSTPSCPLMFAALVVFLLSGYPVAFSLGAVGIVFGFLGIALDLFPRPSSRPCRTASSASCPTSSSWPSPSSPSWASSWRRAASPRTSWTPWAASSVP